MELRGGYNRNAARGLLAEVSDKLSQAAVDQLIREFRLEEVFGFRPGQRFPY